MSGEDFPVRWSGRTAVVTLPVEVDLTVADAARGALLEVLNQGAGLLVVDMTATTFCDSAGITALVRAARRAAACNAEIRVAAATSTVLRVFSLVGIDRLIAIYPSVADAVTPVSSPPGGVPEEAADPPAGELPDGPVPA